MKKLFDAMQDINILAPPEEYIRGLLKALCDNLGYSFGSTIAVDSRRLDRLMDTMLVRIRDTRSKIVIVDITGSHSLDSNTASHLLNIAQAAKLLGATCVITGIKPEIAQTVVRLGLGVELECLTTRKTLQDGLRYGLQKIGYGIKMRDTT
jgi:rsbT co-antagonist protein RsbR